MPFIREQRITARVVLSLALVLASCSDHTRSRRVSSFEIAESNLNSQISSLRELIRSDPDKLVFRSGLNRLLASRAQFFGTYLDDFTEMESLTEESLVRFPQHFEAWKDRAHFLSTVHRFSEAASHLNKALLLGADQTSIELARASIRLATGEELGSARSTFEARVNRVRDFESLTQLAGLESELGHFDRADALFREAYEDFRDVSPFPLAWISFQRGVMWAEKATDHIDRAISHYQEALALAPKYVVANVHLAELLLEHKNKAGALSLLESTLRYTQDPEPVGFLGEILRLDPNTLAQGNLYIARAKSEYESLLSRFGAAFRDHAAEFFMGPGEDIAQGFQLARANLTERKNERAYDLAIRAAALAGEIFQMCQWLKQAVNRAPKQPVLIETIEKHQSRCG